MSTEESVGSFDRRTGVDDGDRGHGRGDADHRGDGLIDAVQQRVRSPPRAVDAIGEQYLTARDGTNLRSEAVTPKGRSKRWEQVVDAFETYVREQYAAAETWDDEKGVRPSSHRFTHEAAKDRYARALGADRAAARLWDGEVTTVHVVRRARAFGRDGQPQPPADHLADLLAANQNVYAAYRRHIGENHGLTYARLSVLEPHRNGYGHVHDGLWVHDPDGMIDEGDVRPAVESHLRGVPQARPSNHADGAISVHHDPDRVQSDAAPDDAPPTTALPRELTKQLGGFAPFDDDRDRRAEAPPVVQADRGRLRFYALLWARGVRQWRPDQSVFPHLVDASQKWFGPLDDAAEGQAAPTDVETDGHSGVATVDADGRPVAFERINPPDAV